MALAPLTSYGIAGASASDAGAASGLVNTCHQVGMAVGLAVIVAVSTTGNGLTGQDQRAMLTSTGPLVLCLLVVVFALLPVAARRRSHE